MTYDKISFQPANTDWGTNLPLQTNGPESILHCVELATPPPQQACYLPSFAGIHLYTCVERSYYGKVPYSRTENVGCSGAQTHNLLFMNLALIC